MTRIRRALPVLLALLFIVPAYGQTTLIKGPLTVAVGETVIFLPSSNPLFPRWSVFPGSSVQIIGSNTGGILTVRIASMPHNGRARVSLGVTDFWFDVVEEPAVLTEAEALRFARRLSRDDLVNCVLAFDLLFACSHRPPLVEDNLITLIKAMSLAYGSFESLLQSAALRMEQVDTYDMFRNNWRLFSELRRLVVR